MKVKTFDGKVFDVPEENLESFLSEYNAAFAPQETPRGANLAGALRNIAQATPIIGTRADELEAELRAPYGVVSNLLAGTTGMPKSIISSLMPEDSKEEYEKWRRNAEESAIGNIENTPYGRALHIGTSMAENAVLAGLTGGLTLTSPVSALQGVIEGSGEGSTPEERAWNAAIQGTISTVIPRIANKLAPTKETSKQIIKEYAKRPLETAKLDKKAGLTILARSLQSGRPVEQVVAEDVSKGYRPNLWNNLRRAFKNEDVLRGKFYKSAAELDRPLYGEYVEQEVRSVAPKYANKIGQNIKKAKLEKEGSDILSNIDIREVAQNAVNDAMRKAPAADKKIVRDTIETAIAKKGVAKNIQKAAIASPADFEGTWSSLFRTLRGIPSNISNYGTIRSMTGDIGKGGNWIRGALDDYLEDWGAEPFKLK